MEQETITQIHTGKQLQGRQQLLVAFRVILHMNLKGLTQAQSVCGPPVPCTWFIALSLCMLLLSLTVTSSGLMSF